MKIEHIAKNFDPGAREKDIYAKWMAKGSFNAEINKEKEVFTIVMPPPNITGQLHIGHALDLSLQDILIRYHRMLGQEALWLPGYDHAAIATEVRVIQELQKEGLSKADLGREGFLERAFAWKEKYAGRIVEQSKAMGFSCDWRRSRFTMDDGLSEAVKKAFIILYEDGLIYKGDRIVNWCPCCKTTISDAEVEYEEENGKLWHFQYPFKDKSGYLCVATTRPETIPGDTAVAVNPSDERYKDFIGKIMILPVNGKEIPVLSDDYVEAEFGTGCVKITPAHDPNDFEVGVRNNLPMPNIMDEAAVMNENAGKYAGMSREEARKAIVADLDAGGYLVKTEDYRHSVGRCYRCDTVVEPRLSLQWFVKMQELAEPAIKAVEDGEIRFIPERFSKNYFHWMKNIKDWCISRQLWWGHPIPAYECGECEKITVAAEKPEKCAYCGAADPKQDPDTLDTWFSSALWPFSVFGWPDKTPELDYFYPTHTLVTGYDIITFWVSRMIFSALRYTGKIPFKDVFIHGLVRDEHGAKMSKSSGNGIDPMDVMAEYGTDALRFALINAISTGSDISFSDRRVEAGRNFVNKLWNSFRFILMNLDEDVDYFAEEPEYSEEDLDMFIKCAELAKDATRLMDQPEPGLALATIYSFFRSEFCDKYIESVKPDLRAGGMAKKAAMRTLLECLITQLKLIHPFMPFVTEEIYSLLPASCKQKEQLIREDWPCASSISKLEDPEKIKKISENCARMHELIHAVRNIRADLGVDLSKKPDIVIKSSDKELLAQLKAAWRYIAPMARLSDLREVSDDYSPKAAIPVNLTIGSVFVPLGDLVDLAEEKARLAKEEKALLGQIKGSEAKLAQEAFVSKAPTHVVEAEREKLAKLRQTLEKNRALAETLAD